MCRFCDYAGEPIAGCDDVAAEALYGSISAEVDRRMFAAWWTAMQDAVLGLRSGAPTGLLAAFEEPRPSPVRPRSPMVEAHPELVTRVQLCPRAAPPQPVIEQRRDHTVHADGSITLHRSGWWEFEMRTHPAVADGVMIFTSPDPDRPGRVRFTVAVDPAVRPPAAP